MKETVFFIKMTDNQDDASVCERLAALIKEKDLFSFVAPKDMVAVKTHFGEQNTNGYVRPVYMKAIAELLKEKKALPFLTETSTLYRGVRTNAVEHIRHACKHGFDLESTGMPIIMADGLVGDEETPVEIPGKHYKKVGVASMLAKCQGAVFVSHFTGHMLAGFGAAVKALGMGCVGRKAKVRQHSTAKPSIKLKACVGCGDCYQWCPHGAISMVDDKAKIKNSKCVGCAECLAVCRFDAVGYNWGEACEVIQQKIVEHAMGVVKVLKGKAVYINFLNHITKDCDCMHDKYEKITPDIGVLISSDPVAVDAASLDLVETRAGKQLREMAYDITHRVQLQYAKEMGFGNAEYELVEV